MVVPDTRLDERFACNPLVTAADGLRFYAGALLKTQEGLPLGTVCVLDREPRPQGITQHQRLTLEVLARLAMNQLEMRRVIEHQHAHAAQLEAEIRDRKSAEAARRLADDRYRSLFNSLDAGFCIIEVAFDASDKATDYRFLEINPAFARQTGLADATGKWMRELVPNHEQHWFDIYGRVAKTGEPVRFENPAKALDDRWFDVHAFRVGDAEAGLVAILFNDITERRRSELRRNALLRIGDRLRSLDTVPEITGAASQIVGETLDAVRVGFGRIDAHRRIRHHRERLGRRRSRQLDRATPGGGLRPSERSGRRQAAYRRTRRLHFSIGAFRRCSDRPRRPVSGRHSDSGPR